MWYNPNSGAKQIPTLTKSTITALGPFPWHAVAAAKKENLILHHWDGTIFGEKSLPNLKDATYSVALMSKINAEYTVKYSNGKERLFKTQWDNSKSHQKIAFSADDSKNTVCIGDANNVDNQVQHAGLVYCFASSEIRNMLKSWTISALPNYPDQQEVDVLKGSLDFLNEKQTKKHNTPRPQSSSIPNDNRYKPQTHSARVPQSLEDKNGAQAFTPSPAPTSQLKDSLDNVDFEAMFDAAYNNINNNNKS